MNPTLSFLTFLPFIFLFSYQMVRVGKIMRSVTSLKAFYDNYEPKAYDFFTRLFFIQFDKNTFFHPWQKRSWEWAFKFLGDRFLTLWFKFCGYFFMTFGVATTIAWILLILANFFFRTCC